MASDLIKKLRKAERRLRDGEPGREERSQIAILIARVIEELEQETPNDR